MRIDATWNGQELTFFQYQAGQQGPGINISTLADTNMPANGHLPTGHEFLIYSIQVIPDEILSQAQTVGDNTYTASSWLGEETVHAAMQKWNTIMANLIFQFKIEQSKVFVEGRLDHFPAGGGIHFEHTEAFAAPEGDDWDTSYIITNGIQSWEATRRLAMPVYIMGLETFRGLVVPPRGALDFDGGPIDWDYGFGLTVRLTGPRRRPTI